MITLGLERTAHDRVRTIDPELLLQQLRSGRRLTILDIRDRSEFRAGRIPGARSVPLQHLEPRLEEFMPHYSEPVILVSERGIRSRAAALQLELAGFTEVQSLEGGMCRWRELGLPVDVL
jgi:rhodanese-related sulfurtransferase